MNKYANHPVLTVKSIDELRAIVGTQTISWSNIVKLHGKTCDLPLYRLTNGSPGDTLSERVYRTLHGSTACKMCSSLTGFYSWAKGFSTYCSTTCRKKDAELAMRSSLATQRTMLERYGATSTMGSAELRMKTQLTNIERYGHISPAKNLAVQARKEATMIERYGHISPAKNPKVAQKSAASKTASTFARRLVENDHVTYIDDRVFSQLEDRMWHCNECKTQFTHNWSMKQRHPICRVCQPMIKGTSRFETEIKEFIGQFADVEQSKRFYEQDGLTYRELDLYLDDHKLGIEFNGLYWHSELAGKSRDYHVKKMEFFRKRGIKLISIFEHEWVRKRAICESMITHKIGRSNRTVYARSCKIEKIDLHIARAFAEANHIAGHANCSTALALVENGELLAVATFRADRFGRDKNVVELIRFCSTLNTSVVGGLSRLISAYGKLNACTIKTFSDLRWGDGSGYLHAGFKHVKNLPACSWYFNQDQEVFHRSVFQKKKLLTLLGLHESTQTEWQLAQQLKLNRYWDCGHAVFIKELT